MAISRFNSEGYPDPTTYEALSKIEKEERAARYRPLVYICSPFSGDISANIDRARKYSRYAVDSKAIPIAPHLLFHSLWMKVPSGSLPYLWIWFCLAGAKKYGYLAVTSQTAWLRRLRRQKENR